MNEEDQCLECECGSQNFILIMTQEIRCADCWGLLEDAKWIFDVTKPDNEELH